MATRPRAIEVERSAPPARTGKTTLLVLRSEPCEVAFPSVKVSHIEDAGSSAGSDVLDLEQALGLQVPSSAARVRLLSLSGRQRTFRVRTRGGLEVREVALAERLALPAGILGRCPFTELVLSGGAPAILVVDLDALEELLE